MDVFGTYISKCNRLSENIRHIQAIEVLYRLRNKQKHYLIYSETPCILGWKKILNQKNFKSKKNCGRKKMPQSGLGSIQGKNVVHIVFNAQILWISIFLEKLKNLSVTLFSHAYQK